MNKMSKTIVAALFYAAAWLPAQAGKFSFAPLERFNEVREDAGSAQITIVRRGTAGDAASVRVRTANRTAVAGADYQAVDAVVTFAPNETAKTVTIPIFADTAFEGNERFRVELSEASGATLAGKNTAESIFINDAQDDPPNDDFAAAQVLAGGSGSVQGTNAGASREPVEPTHPTPANRSVWYTYTAPGDGLATFRNGNNNFSTILAVYAGSSVEALSRLKERDDSDDRTFAVRVQAGGVYHVAVDDRSDPEDSNDRDDSDDSNDGHGRGGGPFLLKWKTLLPGTLRFSSAEYSAGETGASAEITVVRAGGSNREVTVDYTTRDGTALADTDYTAASGTLVFADGETSKTFSIPILDDAIFEQRETVRLKLRNATGGALLGRSRATLHLENDDAFTPGAGKYTALAGAGSFANAAAGRAAFEVGALGAMTGKLALGGVTYRLKGFFDGFNRLVITKGRGPLADLTIDLQLSDDGAEISGTVSDGTFTAQIAGLRNGYNAATDPAPQQGRYTVSLPGDDLSTASGFPKGDGWAKMNVSADGIASVLGVLADGTVFGTSVALSKTGEAPLYLPLYKKQGSLSGKIVFAANPGVSDAAGTLHWFKPAGVPGTPRYPQGFSTGLPFAGSAYLFTAGARVLAGLEAGGGAAAIVFGEGNLPADLSQAVNLGTDNVFRLSPPQTVRLQLALKPKNGIVSGTFRQPGSTRDIPLRGVVLQAQSRAAGFFLGGSESGFFRLAPPPP